MILPLLPLFPLLCQLFIMPVTFTWLLLVALGFWTTHLPISSCFAPTACGSWWWKHKNSAFTIQTAEIASVRWSDVWCTFRIQLCDLTYHQVFLTCIQYNTTERKTKLSLFRRQEDKLSILLHNCIKQEVVEEVILVILRSNNNYNA